MQKGQAAGLVFFLVIVKKRDFGRLAVYNQRNQDKSMNLKRIIWTSCFAAVVLTASFALGQPHRGGGSMGMRGGQTFSHGGMGTWGGRNWNGGNWSGRNGGNWSGRNWSGGNWSGNWRHHHHHGGSDFIFIGDFGFPFWGWGWGYPYGYGYGYGSPYGYGYGSPDGYGYGSSYGYGYPNGYGNPYGNDNYYGGSAYGRGYGNRSTVAQVQRRLAQAGYYHGAIDGIMGPQTRRAIRAYERDRGDRGQSSYGAVEPQLPAANSLS